MKIHFIAIGGAVMHNLAIVLKRNGHEVTGSDDEIFEPSASRLREHGLLPPDYGWYPEKIKQDTDTVILGMHAREDNPELIKATEIGIDIKSFPEFLYDQTKDRLRIVIGGSHGKTTITAMIMHVLRFNHYEFDYMCGSKLEGFETMVGLSEKSKIAVFEGDEYLSSAIDRRPKFHLYKADLAVINGISWDHINVFPDFDEYLEQFRLFADSITKNGKLVYFSEDALVNNIAGKSRDDIKKIPYRVHGYFQNKKGFFAATHNRVQKMNIFGEHNMQNLSAAKAVCSEIGISDNDFYAAMESFRGPHKRMELLSSGDRAIVYSDFAHAPSKVKATVEAIAERYPSHRIVACLELHTFSSLNQDFIENYRSSLNEADESYVYYNPHALKLKKMRMLDNNRIRESFGNDNLKVMDDSDQLFYDIYENAGKESVYLFMSSANFNGNDLKAFAAKLTGDD
ncbi:MAG TPA: Mur ligase family protein [Bacteroidales bacterium]|nr:Mur ligase family protein [Bacteroidales bacterium]